MRETNIYDYFALGYNYFIIRYRSEGKAAKGADSAKSVILQFLRHVNELGLDVTRQAAADLIALGHELEALPNGTVVDSTMAQRLRKACDRIDSTLDAELQLRTTYVVTPKRFAQAHLLDRPEELLSPGVAARLPAIGRFDFASAARCIAFGLATASAFHTMRCLESMLRHYYCSIVKRKRVQPLLWGPILTHLRTHRRPPPKVLLDHLDNIRSNFRNPTQHPDARYDLDEAQDLLALAIDALNRIARDMETRAV